MPERSTSLACPVGPPRRPWFSVDLKASNPFEAAGCPSRRFRYWGLERWRSRTPAPQSTPASADRPDDRTTTRPTVMELWGAAFRDLQAAGAEIVLVDFPVVSNYEGDRPGAPTIDTRGLVSTTYLHRETVDLMCLGLGRLPARQRRSPPRPPRRRRPRTHLPAPTSRTLPRAWPGSRNPPPRLQGLAKRSWPRRRNFPGGGDIGPADMDVNETSVELGWRNGVWVANGNLVLRHLGIPIVTVPMGTLADIGMPVGLTFAGRAYDDAALLALAAAFEATGRRRSAPPRNPRCGPTINDYRLGARPARSTRRHGWAALGHSRVRRPS